jgi:hypothetical protein
MRVILSSLIALVALGSGCGAKLADCEALARDQSECMPDSAVAACEATNAQCEETGSEVLVLESCPLQFACDTTSP